jgi:hypothetical protein
LHLPSNERAADINCPLHYGNNLPSPTDQTREDKADKTGDMKDFKHRISTFLLFSFAIKF